MSRLRVGSLSNPFNKSGDSSKSPMRPSADRSQSALLPLRSINNDSAMEEGDDVLPTSTNGTAESTSAQVRRNRAHTVAVAIGPPTGRRGSAPKDGRRRGSSITSPRSLEEGREREGSPVHFELGREQEELNDEVVGMLDVIDPEVSTVNHLQNMTNSIIVPHFPALWSRRPEVRIPESPTEDREDETLVQEEQGDQVPPMSSRRRSSTTRSYSRQPRSRSSTVTRMYPPAPQSDDLSSIKPVRISSPTYDVESAKEDDELDTHVKNVLASSKRAKIKRGLRGFWAFVKTPIGAFTAIYGFLCAFWGAAIVLFLLGWIPTSSKDTQDKWVEISSQVCNGLFTITGVGLIPWRVIDTYRISVIWTLKRRTERLRDRQGLPPIEDPNDIPNPVEAKDYVSVLTEHDQERLRVQQEKFAASQTWYKPHATKTHKAFPMAWALWNTILMDGNSFFQCILCGCMWGLNRHQRPAWTTGSLIPLSFLCGIGAAILIWQGSVRTKKTISVEEKLRNALSLPLAIAIPQTKDGTVITGHNNAPLPKGHDDPTVTRARTRGEDGSDDGKGLPLESAGLVTDDDRPDVLRRSTIAFGTSGEKEVEMRQRGSSIAAPEREAASMGGQGVSSPIREATELEEREAR